MGIKVIQVREEWTLLRSSTKPVKKGRVDVASGARLQSDPFSLEEVATKENVVEDPASRHSPAQERPGGEGIVLKMDEAAIQPCFVGANKGVRREPGGKKA